MVMVDVDMPDAIGCRKCKAKNILILISLDYYEPPSDGGRSVPMHGCCACTQSDTERHGVVTSGDV